MLRMPQNAVFNEQQPVADFLADRFVKFDYVRHEFVGNAENDEQS